MRVSLALLVMLAGASVGAVRGAPGRLLKVYNDESRQLQGPPASLWTTLKRKDGCLLTRGLGLPQYERISQYDVVMVCNRANEGIAYSDEELGAFRRFVEEGGGLYLAAQPGMHVRSQPGQRGRTGFTGKPIPIPTRDLASNQVAGLFGVAFTQAHGTDAVVFAPGSPMNAGVEMDRDDSQQPVCALKCDAPGSRVLASASGRPVVGYLQYGKGRVIVSGAPDLFRGPGPYSAARRLGQTKATTAMRVSLLTGWLRWLSANSPRLGRRAGQPLPKWVEPSVRREGAGVVLYCIPQLTELADGVMAKWNGISKGLAQYVGLDSLRDMDREGGPLTVYLRPGRGAGFAGADAVHVAGREPPAILQKLGHEVGHKLIGAPNMSVGEAFAIWSAHRTMTLLGDDAAARDIREKQFERLRAADPTGRRLDIADPDTEVNQLSACRAKWVWILSELEARYGDDIVARYAVAIRAGLGPTGTHRKTVNGRTAPLTMDDVVHYLGEAAGEDLVPWFRSLGITVNRLQ